jgi:hypothetical protein
MAGFILTGRMTDKVGREKAATSDKRPEDQSEQVVGCVGSCAMLNASADPCNLSCRANVCGEEIEV